MFTPPTLRPEALSVIGPGVGVGVGVAVGVGVGVAVGVGVGVGVPPGEIGSLSWKASCWDMTMPGSGCSGSGVTTSENAMSASQVTPLSVDLRAHIL
ncbi:MAG: hypothetical protein DMG96_30350 [Acidobacteria bacterium]|nr:MAG: hypothetical protein DMG96_30350 [Acidobacteriota bacterium]